MNRSNIIAAVLFSIFHFPFSIRAEIAVTIYNQDLALVREMRDLDFPKGTGEVRFVDVAARIIPTSVAFSSDRAAMLEQNYEYDLVSSDRLLQKFLDAEVELTTQDNRQFSGVLLSSAGDVVLQDRDGSIRSISRGQIVNVRFPTLPEGLITRPTLVWLVEGKGGKGKAEISYLTNGMTWEAEYVAVSREDDRSLNLTGWVNINNNSGTTYRNAKLKLMAGDVQVIKPRRDVFTEDLRVMSAGSALPQFKEQDFFEYHLYTLGRPATLADNQIKQLALFPSASVGKVKKEYRFESGGWRSGDRKVKVFLSFDNSEPNGLGIALPKGKVRLYKDNPNGGQEFIGEDLIDHTPRNEKVRVSTGSAFDIVGERNQIDTKRGGREQAFEIKIRNRKKETVTVTVAESLHGDWSMLEATPGWVKKSATLVEWEVSVKPDEEQVITYRVLFNY